MTKTLSRTGMTSRGVLRMGTSALAASGKFLAVSLLALTAASLIAVGQPAHAASATPPSAWQVVGPTSEEGVST